MAGEEGVAAIGRAFAVLQTLRGDELALADITRRTGLAKTTAHRVLATLVDLGAVERCTGGYRLGALLFELGGDVAGRTDLREAALPFLQDLYQVTQETVHLAVLDGAEVLYLERIHGHRAPRQLASRIAGRQPAHCTGVGKALLAFDPGAAATVLASAPLEARTPYTITAPRLLARELEAIRASLVAVDRDENAIGIHCVATPVLVGGRLVAAISVTGPAARISEERVASAVRTASLGLGRLLASRPLPFGRWSPEGR